MWWLMLCAAVLATCAVMTAVGAVGHRRWLREFERTTTRADEAWQAEMDHHARDLAATRAEVEAHRDGLRERRRKIGP